MSPASSGSAAASSDAQKSASTPVDHVARIGERWLPARPEQATDMIGVAMGDHDRADIPRPHPESRRAPRGRARRRARLRTRRDPRRRARVRRATRSTARRTGRRACPPHRARAGRTAPARRRRSHGRRTAATPCGRRQPARGTRSRPGVERLDHRHTVPAGRPETRGGRPRRGRPYRRAELVSTAAAGTRSRTASALRRRASSSRARCGTPGFRRSPPSWSRVCRRTRPRP